MSNHDMGLCTYCDEPLKRLQSASDRIVSCTCRNCKLKVCYPGFGGDCIDWDATNDRSVNREKILNMKLRKCENNLSQNPNDEKLEMYRIKLIRKISDRSTYFSFNNIVCINCGKI